MTYAAGTYGIDSASSVDGAVAFQTGSRFQLRYSAGAGNSVSATQWKLCKPGEIASILATGQDFVANSEWYEDRVTEGAAAGDQDGAADLAFWSSHGLAPGSTIYPSWDRDPDPAKYQAVADYLGHYNAALRGEYVGNGMYAGADALRYLQQHGLIQHAWIPEATSWSGLPGWYYQPTKAQLAETTAAVAKLVPGIASSIWQNGNHWFNGQADEDIVVVGGPIGSHNEAKGGAPAPTPPPAPAPAPKPVAPYAGAPWPSIIPRNQYFGDWHGPAASHGGYYQNEKQYVKMIQQRLIWFGFVPGHTNINDGWADGLFEAPTTAAVAAFQHAHMPGTQFYGQVWTDDWAKLFSL
jgi:hypothetical protein